MIDINMHKRQELKIFDIKLSLKRLFLIENTLTDRPVVYPR